MLAEKEHWICESRPLTGRLEVMRTFLAGLILIIMARQVILDSVYAWEQYSVQKQIDRELAGAPTRRVQVKVYFDGSRPPDQMSNTSIIGLPHPCPGVRSSFIMTTFVQNWCIYTYVDPEALQKDFVRCPEGSGASDTCTQGTVLIREANGRMSLGDRSRATSYVFLALRLLMSELFVLLELLPLGLMLLIIPELVLDLIYGRSSIF